MQPSRIHRGKHKQRGVVIVWFALFMLLMLGFIALGIDVAKLMTAKTQLQNAADAAALAGASAVDWTNGHLMPDTALVRAQLAASQNKAFIDKSEPVTLAAGDVEFIGNDKLKVTARREGGNSIVVYFAKVLGINSLDMTAHATAQVQPAGAEECGAIPVCVVPAPGDVFHTGCDQNYVLKQGGQGGTQGNYGAIDFPSCDNGDCGGGQPTGADTFKCLVKYGYCCELHVGDQVSTEPGNMSSLKAAMTFRFNQDTDQRQNICYSDYHGNGKRLVTVPLTTSLGDGGRTTVTITGFAQFFVKNVPQTGSNATFDGEFVRGIIAGTGGGSISDVSAYALQLVD